MKQLLRITYNESDYTYHIVNEKSINPSTTEIEIMMDGENYILTKDNKKVWVDKEGNKKVNAELLNAIGRTISLRHRI
jgi:hypothetical protein